MIWWKPVAALSAKSICLGNTQAAAQTRRLYPYSWMLNHFRETARGRRLEREVSLERDA
jgi:hypothetical protein